MTPATARAVVAEQIAHWRALGWTSEMAWQALTGRAERNNAPWPVVADFMVRWLIVEFGVTNFRLAA